MNYQKIYDTLIAQAKSRNLISKIEKHHIVPKCMNGIDDISNIVNLTPREHYIAHLLLWKINKNTIYQYNCLCSILKMQSKSFKNKDRIFKFNSKLYEQTRHQLGKILNGYKWITNGKQNIKILQNEQQDFILPIGWKYGLTFKCGNRIWITNGKITKHIFEYEKIPNGWKIGRACSTTKNMVYYNNGIIQKLFNKNNKIPDGWKRGRLGSSTAGKIYISSIDGKIVKVINKNENIPIGFIKGNIKAHNKLIS